MRSKLTANVGIIDLPPVRCSLSAIRYAARPVSVPVDELIAELGRGAALLDRHGVNARWSSLLRSYADRLGQGDRGVARDLLRQFGGMGSFNDVVIHPLNGHRIRDKDVDPVNKELDRIRHRLYTVARDLR